MASNIHIAISARNVGINAVAALMNGGTINFYSGAQPADAATAHSGNTLLCTLTYGNPAYGSASGGSATANAIASGTIVAAGTCTWAEIVQSNGTTIVMHCSVDVSGNSPDITVPLTAFAVGVTVTMTVNTLSQPA